MNFKTAVYELLDQVKLQFSSPIAGNPEEQLQTPVHNFLSALQSVFGKAVMAKPESRIVDIQGRPDFAVSVAGVLVGYVELKAPGVGVNDSKFRGHDRAQFKRFCLLPNVLYTDGADWRLYRNGQPTASVVSIVDDVTTAGKNKAHSSGIVALELLVRDFISWHPMSPTSMEDLALSLASLCRFLRDAVTDRLMDPGSALRLLKADWDRYLFQGITDEQFADSYSQSVTYALLLAKLNGLGDVTATSAAQALISTNELLSTVLSIATSVHARPEIDSIVSLIERTISAVDLKTVGAHARSDMWLYFYEMFLSHYDPALRKKRGVYYTPFQAVKAQVALVSDLLVTKFGLSDSFASPTVRTLDPAVGTGAYPVAIIDHTVERVVKLYGAGVKSTAATQLASNLFGFELLVGPYTVAQLRVSERLTYHGGRLPANGANIILCDTLEPASGRATFAQSLFTKALTDEAQRAIDIKSKEPIFVCIGNPPYNHERLPFGTEGLRKGGWIRYGDPPIKPLIDDFKSVSGRSVDGKHLKTLYNDYVYFWRWAVWKVIEQHKTPGVVCFISASAYLRGPGFVGMRKVLRELFDEVWIIDLEGEVSAPRPSENIFDITVPVAICVCVAYHSPNRAVAAEAHYTRIIGRREEKLTALSNKKTFADFNWQALSNEWVAPLFPRASAPFVNWPELVDLFSSIFSGVLCVRTWPIAVDAETLKARWQALVTATDRTKLLRETRDRKARFAYPPLPGDAPAKSIASVSSTDPLPRIVEFGYRSFDLQWLIADSRVIDYARPEMWQSHSETQVYMMTIVSKPLGRGPATTLSPAPPDNNYFRGSYAGIAIPLWVDELSGVYNCRTAVVTAWSAALGKPITGEQAFAYCYGVLALPSYVERFWDDLQYSAPRVPLTSDADLFERTVEYGQMLMNLHSFGLRQFGKKPIQITGGEAYCSRAIGVTGYPASLQYDDAAQAIIIGDGEIRNVSREVFDFSVSGYPVVQRYIQYRLNPRFGKSSSDLDKILPRRWDLAMTSGLLRLLWTIEATLKSYETGDLILGAIIESTTVSSSDLPKVARSAAAEAELFDEAINPEKMSIGHISNNQTKLLI